MSVPLEQYSLLDDLYYYCLFKCPYLYSSIRLLDELYHYCICTVQLFDALKKSISGTYVYNYQSGQHIDLDTANQTSMFVSVQSIVI